MEEEVAGAPEPFQLFHGDVLVDSVARYAEKYGLDEEATGALRSRVGQRAMLEGLLPFARVEVRIPEAEGSPARTVTLQVKAGVSIPLLSLVGE